MRANDSKDSGVGTILLSMAAIGLAGMVGTITLINQVGELGPKVGDIVAFEPQEPMSSDMKARVTAVYSGQHQGKSCVLDVRTMHHDGGSLIIEARQVKMPGVMQVHWAGRHSSDSNTDCGATADLLLGPDDLEVLAIAAGGYGVALQKTPHLSFGHPSTSLQ